MARSIERTNLRTNELNSVGVRSKLITNLSNDNLIHMKIRIDLNNSFSPFTRLNIPVRICSFDADKRKETIKANQV